MKTTYLVGCMIACGILLVGCGKPAPIPSLSPLSGQEIMGQSGNVSLEQSGVDSTGEIVSGEQKTQREEIPTSSQQIQSGKSLSTEVKQLIQERAQKPVEKSKLTEDDIDLMEKVIQKIQQK